MDLILIRQLDAANSTIEECFNPCFNGSNTYTEFDYDSMTVAELFQSLF